MPTRTQWLERVESMRQLVQSHAAESERLTHLSQPVVDAIVANRLFRLWIPRDYDGQELDLPDALRVFEAAAAIDGAFGWAVTIGVGGALFAPLLAPEVAREVYAPAAALIAGSGHPGGTLQRSPGGFTANGRWQYCSGAHHANFITASCRVLQADGSLELDATGKPLLRALAVSAGQVTIDLTWDTLGLRGTGSHDIVIENVFVPEDHIFDVLGVPNVAGPLYRHPFMSMAATSFAAVAVGLGQSCIEHFTGFAQKKRLRSGELLIDHTITKTNLTTAELLVKKARVLMYTAADAEWSTTLTGKAPAEGQTSATLSGCASATQAALDAANMLYRIAGMTPLHLSDPFGRAWRDLHTVSQHILLSPLWSPPLDDSGD
jgi:alkylation response protein AidB-like acyl-CoA dehydrogenase